MSALKHVTAEECTVGQHTFPAGTRVAWIPNGGWALLFSRDAFKAFGNEHDAKHRWAYLPEGTKVKTEIGA